MQGYLLGDFKVEIDKRCAEVGGCWQGTPRNGMPTAWGEDVLQYFYNITLRYEEPVIIDIGANTGAFSLLASMNPKMRSYAFEPMPLTYELLCNNIFLNGLQHRIKSFQVALSDRNGKAVLKYPTSGKDSGLACIGNPLRFKEWTEYEVDCRRLDDFAAQNGIDKADIIKIDTEGCDLFVLKGAEEYIRRCSPNIFCECSESNNGKTNTGQFGYAPREIVQLLESWGYSYEIVGEEDIYFYLPKRVPTRSVTPLAVEDVDPSRLPDVIRELCSRNEFDKALTKVLYAQEKFPNSPDLHNLEAELRYRLGDKEKAKAILVAMTKLWPDYTMALKNLGLIFQKEGAAEAALQYFAKLLAINPYDRDTVNDYARITLRLKDFSRAGQVIQKYLGKFPEDTEVRKLAQEINVAKPGAAEKAAYNMVSQFGYPDIAKTRVVLSSGTLPRYNGGTKIYNLWVSLLRKHGYDAYIATMDGSFDRWLVNHERVISYEDVAAFRRNGDDVRVISGWLDTPEFERLLGGQQFYYFDAELFWTLQFRDKFDSYLSRNMIARIATHSRYIQGWYMANYGIKPLLINEFSDEGVFFEEPRTRVENRLGYMPDIEQDRETIEIIAKGLREFIPQLSVIEVKGDEKAVADLMRTVDIFVGLNAGRHPFWGEGCPRTQQEALHSGCVLAAYDCLGNREYLYDNWTGLMVRPGDVEGLSSKIKFILGNRDEKERLRANSKAIAAALFSERGKHELISSFLDFSGITKDELAAVFPQPFCLHEHEIPFIAKYASAAKKGIVEIGCAYGGSTSIILLNKKKGVPIVSIDPFVKDSKGDFQAEEKACCEAVIVTLNRKNHGEAIADWNLIRGYSQEVADNWDGQIDMLFIDGSHHYADIKSDFEKWSKFVSPGGKILMHDSRKNNIAEDPDDKIFSRGWHGPTRLATEIREAGKYRLVDTCYSISVFESVGG